MGIKYVLTISADGHMPARKPCHPRHGKRGDRLRWGLSEAKTFSAGICLCRVNTYLIPRIFAAILFLAVAFPASAQFYQFGADPSSAKWRQIKSEHYKLVYPQEIDSMAREYLRALEKYRDAVNEPLKIDPKPIPVILHPYSTLSNGMVAWCPKGMHLVTSPNPYSDSQVDWTSQLVIHELKHVGQCEHFTKGEYRVLYPLLGESVTGIGMALFSSTAYLEGDATMSETLLTPGGRGRMASFMMQIRSEYLQGKYRNVEGHLLYSYHDKPYDPYALGFLAMTSELMRTDNYFYPYDFFRANALCLGGIAMRRSKVPFTLYDENFAQMQQIATNTWWDDMMRRGEFTTGKRLSDSTRLYCDYIGAMDIMDTLSPLHGSIVAQKSGMEFSNQLVRIDPDGKETVIRYHAPYSSKMSEDKSGRLFWSESVKHDPSEAESFSEIFYYDSRSGKVGNLTRNTKYFNPSVCENDTHMAVAEYPVTGSTFLVMLSMSDGAPIARVPAPRNGQIQETVFVGDYIYATIIFPEGVGIWKISEDDVLEHSANWIEVLPAQACEVRNLRHSHYRNGIYFASDLDGVLNLYAYAEESGELYRLTNSKFGANYPFVDSEHNALYYSEYDDKGYHIVRTPIDSLQVKPMDWNKPYVSPVIKALVAQKEEQSRVDIVDDPSYLNEEKYPSKPYNKFLNSFKIHSWAPFYYNADRILNMSGDQLYSYISLGAVAYSQNDLGTVQSMLGYSYHGGFHSGHAKILTRLFDFDVEAAFDINDRKQRIYDWTSSGYRGSDGDSPYMNFQLTVDYPINYYSGGWSTMFVPIMSWRITNDRFCGESDYTDQSASAGFRYFRMLPIPRAAIFPRWGYSLSAYHAFSLNTNEKMPLSFLELYSYFPGIDRNQGVKFLWQGQYRHTPQGTRYFNNSYASLPRGYTTAVSGLPSQKYMKFSLDYAIPIWLHDITIPWVIYLKRLELIPFGDFAIQKDFSNKNSNFWSAGTDLTVAFNLIRFTIDFKCGVRYAYTGPQGDASRHTFSFLFNLEI